MDASKPKHLHIHRDGGVLDICIDYGKGNVLDRAVMAELDAALASHADVRDLKMVVLRAAGPHFSFGASVEDHRLALAPDMLREFHALCRLIAHYPVPIAAIVQGRCLGGAFEVVLCCHLVFATPDANFACPEVQLGVFPPVLAAIGHLRLGGALAERMLLTGASLNAQGAERCGLLAGDVSQDSPQPAVIDWYRRNLEPLSAFAIRQAVQAARRGSGLTAALATGLDAAEAQYLREVLTSHDGNEGIEAFLARRKPVWSHT